MTIYVRFLTQDAHYTSLRARDMEEVLSVHWRPESEIRIVRNPLPPVVVGAASRTIRKRARRTRNCSFDELLNRDTGGRSAVESRVLGYYGAPEIGAKKECGIRLGLL